MKRALKQTPPPAPALRAPVELWFDDIAGIDPCNVRRIEASDERIAELAHDIATRGLLNPLIVRGLPGAWRVLAGGCRWRALKLTAKPGDLVRARVFDGDDEAAASLSFAENVERQDLHELEEADRVAEMALNQRPEAVARQLGRPERYVRRCLALSALPEVARAAWLAGEIEAPHARALSAAPPAAVEALFANPQAKAILTDVRLIRAALLPKGVPATSPAARFVGLPDYVAAGGALHEDLFGDEAWCLDPELLRRLERQKLARAADDICHAEGWGVQLFEPGEVERCASADFTADEIDRLRAIEAVGSPALDAEADAIHRRALLRAIPESHRARFGVYVGLDSEGRLDVVRGVMLDISSQPIVEGPAVFPQTPTGSLDAAASDTPPEAADPVTLVTSKTKPPLTLSLSRDAPILNAAARRLADMAASRAAAEAIAFLLPGDAVRVALVAMLAKGRSPVAISCTHGPGGTPLDLLRRLAKLDFAAALHLAGDACDEDVDKAFAAVVAASVDVRGADEAATRGLVGFIERTDMNGFDPVFAKHFDYAAFFAAAGRPASLSAIRDCAGPAAQSERAWMKDEQLAEEAALLARAKAWTPDYLRVPP